MIEIVWLGIGLAMDAFAVSIAGGVINSKLSMKSVWKMACIFGLFQGTMPLIGLAATTMFNDTFEKWDHWLAFGLLVLIGLKMLWEATRKHQTSSMNFKKNSVLLTLAVATSIDAMAAGFTLPLLEVSTVTAVLVITTVTIIFCSVGPKIGQVFGHLFQKKAEIFGALLLIALGTRILLVHTGWL